MYCTFRAIVSSTYLRGCEKDEIFSNGVGDSIYALGKIARNHCYDVHLPASHRREEELKLKIYDHFALRSIYKNVLYTLVLRNIICAILHTYSEKLCRIISVSNL